MTIVEQDANGQVANWLCLFNVIVRAFEDEPVKMEVVGFGQGFFIVRAVGGTAELPFHSKDVYKYDGERYEQLVNAFTSRDGTTLASLWYVASLAARQ